MALTDKQSRFVEEYMVDLNATQAAIRAGYSIDTARSIASENLSKPDVQEAIQLRKQSLSESTGITAERVLAEYAKIAFSDVRNILNEKGGLINMSEMPDDISASVASVESWEERDRETGLMSGTTRKIRMYDKLRALEAIGKHIGLFEKDNKQKQTEVVNHISLGAGIKPPEDE